MIRAFVYLLTISIQVEKGRIDIKGKQLLMVEQHKEKIREINLKAEQIQTKLDRLQLKCIITRVFQLKIISTNP